MTSIVLKQLDPLPVHGRMYSVDTFCDKSCQIFASGRWFFPGTQFSSTCKAIYSGAPEDHLFA